MGECTNHAQNSGYPCPSSLEQWNLTVKNPVCANMGWAARHRKILLDEDDLDYVEHEVAQITSTGSVNTTFHIPGRTTIPTDDDEYSVTIADLKLDMKVTWVCIPKADTCVHLEVSSEAKIYLLNLSVSCSFHKPTSRIFWITLSSESSPALAKYTLIKASSHDQISQMSVHKPCSTVLLGKFFFGLRFIQVSAK